jgi:hypothetical protein
LFFCIFLLHCFVMCKTCRVWLSVVVREMLTLLSSFCCVVLLVASSSAVGARAVAGNSLGAASSFASSSSSSSSSRPGRRPLLVRAAPLRDTAHRRPHRRPVDVLARPVARQVGAALPRRRRAARARAVRVPDLGVAGADERVLRPRALRHLRRQRLQPRGGRVQRRVRVAAAAAAAAAAVARGLLPLAARRVVLVGEARAQGARERLVVGPAGACRGVGRRAGGGGGGGDEAAVGRDLHGGDELLGRRELARARVPLLLLLLLLLLELLLVLLLVGHFCGRFFSG